MKFAYTIVYVQHVTKTVQFYETAFGLRKRFIHESGQYAEMETEGVTLAFVDNELAKASLPSGIYESRRERQPAGIEIAFTTADVAAAYSRAVDAGALGIVPPTEKPWGQTISYVRDLDGVLVELCTPMG